MDGGYEGTKRGVYLKWASHFGSLFSFFIFPQRREVLGGLVVWPGGVGPPDQPPPPRPMVQQ